MGLVGHGKVERHRNRDDEELTSVELLGLCFQGTKGISVHSQPGRGSFVEQGMGAVLVSRAPEGAPKTAFVPWTLLASPPMGPPEPRSSALCALPGLPGPAHCQAQAAGTKAAHMLI